MDMAAPPASHSVFKLQSLLIVPPWTRAPAFDIKCVLLGCEYSLVIIKGMSTNLPGIDRTWA